jgi:hypothetical protein
LTYFEDYFGYAVVAAVTNLVDEAFIDASFKNFMASSFSFLSFC